MRIGSEPLLQALRSAASSPEAVMKLAKKNDLAVLSFEITVVTRQNKKVSVTQDVKIEVMRPQDVEKLSEPMCPEPDVSWCMISERLSLRVDRFISFCPL